MSSKKDAQILVLTTGLTLIATLEELSSELGEPDCKLVEPFFIKKSYPLGWISPTIPTFIMILYYKKLKKYIV